MTGPSGGEWVHTTATMRDVPTRCDKCERMVTTGIWQYFVGLVSHARVCDACADGNDPKEVTMNGTAGITPEILAEIALALEGANEDWVQGRAASPDTRDFVLVTERILTDRIGPEYLWLADGTTGESVADALYELQCEGKLSEWAEMAEWLAGMVTVGEVA